MEFDDKVLSEFEKKIQYKYKNRDLLVTALTHSSYANEVKKSCRFNERLEFLGDSVLGMVTAEYLFNKYPDYPEGKLTKLRISLVCEDALYQFAKRIDLGSYLRLGHGEIIAEGYKRPSILSDAFEALIASIYLDGGIKEAKKFILRFISDFDGDKKEYSDYKTLLQEIVQKNHTETLEYVVVGESGPDHDKRFTVEVHLDSNVIGVGTEHSKKKAEQSAAREALKLMGINV